eukprot:1295970-Ditylum_brightwellii.AAC.1
MDDVLKIGKTRDAISNFISSLKTGDEGLIPDVKGRENSVCLPLLHKDLDGLECKQSWHFRSDVGLLSYFQGTSHPEIAIDVYQCARLTNQPTFWSKADAVNPENVMSHTDFVIMYAGCLVLCQSKFQMKIALSTAEAEYTALSSAMHK